MRPKLSPISRAKRPESPLPRSVRTPDDVHLRYFVAGEDRAGALPLVLANGLGGPVGALRRPMEELAQTRRVISWDYRGLYGSAFSGAKRDVSVRAHARDVRSILDDLGIERAALLGWSMGVQVGLELARTAPERLAGLVLLNGVAGRPLEGMAVPGAARWVPEVLARLEANPKWAERALWTVGGLPGLERALKTVGWIRPEFPSPDFQSFLGEFRALDLSRYFSLLRALIEHDASGWLEHVRAPTLVLASERDFITPPKHARRLAARLPNARFILIPRVSHYAAAEAPEVVVELARDFLEAEVDDRGLALSRPSDHDYDAP